MSLAGLMATAEGREIWRLHGETVDVTMDIRPGGIGIFDFAGYVKDRENRGRSMSASVKRECDYPIYGHGLTITEEDEAILDRIWAENPVTEAEIERAEAFDRIIRPGTRAPMPDWAIQLTPLPTASWLLWQFDLKAQLVMGTSIALHIVYLAILAAARLFRRHHARH